MFCRVSEDIGEHVQTSQEPTQLFLKQSCEQKKLSLRPSLRHVGHCNAPASLVHSSPMHCFAGAAAISSVMTVTAVLLECLKSCDGECRARDQLSRRR